MPLSFDESQWRQFPIMTLPGPQELRAAVSDAEIYFVSARSRDLSISHDSSWIGTRISPQGQVLDTEGLSLIDDVFLSMASNRISFLVLGRDDNGTALVNGEPVHQDDTINAKLIINANKYLILSDPQLTIERRIEFRFNAAPGHSFEIEYSENLKNWDQLTTFSNFSGEAIVTDGATAATGQRFYRARRLNR